MCIVVGKVPGVDTSEVGICDFDQKTGCKPRPSRATLVKFREKTF
jgi:hypothetical protein